MSVILHASQLPPWLYFKAQRTAKGMTRPAAMILLIELLPCHNFSTCLLISQFMAPFNRFSLTSSLKLDYENNHRGRWHKPPHVIDILQQNILKKSNSSQVPFRSDHL